MQSFIFIFDLSATNSRKLARVMSRHRRHHHILSVVAQLAQPLTTAMVSNIAGTFVFNFIDACILDVIMAASRATA